MLSSKLQPGTSPAETIAGKWFPQMCDGHGGMVIITDGGPGPGGPLHAYISKTPGDMVSPSCLRCTLFLSMTVVNDAVWGTGELRRRQAAVDHGAPTDRHRGQEGRVGQLPGERTTIAGTWLAFFQECQQCASR